ncbi:MAG: TonB-dependent receptor [Flavobacteriaceae bacterium]
MKNYILCLAFLALSYTPLIAQDTQTQDSTATQNLDEVLVKAVRVQPNAPITHSNVTRKDIAKRNLGQDIPVLLNYLPSVVSSSDAGAGIGYTYLRVRGSDATRVNVTINGIPYNDAESQGTFWVNLGDFASSVESLQLQRGVGTSTNGSGAFGASLNILTDAISQEAGGEISNAFGSFGTRKHTVKFSTGLLDDHFEFAGRLSKIYSDGYVDRAFTDLKSYFLQGNYIDDNTIVKAITFGGKEKTYQSWYGLDKTQLEEDRTQNPYTYDNETDNYWQDHYQLHWNETLNFNWATNIGLNYTRGKGYFEQFKDDRSAADYNDLINDDSDVIVRRWLDNHFYVVNANATYQKNGLEIISGISYSDYTNDHYGEVIWGSDLAAGTSIRDRYYLSISDKTDFSVFSKATFKVNDKLQVFLDLQNRFVNYTTTGLTSERVPIDIDANFSFFNPKLGLTYDLNPNNSLYASYARANKAPNRNDFESNATDVTHEELNDFELGWRHQSERLRLNANLYYMRYNNQLVLTGALDNVGEYLRENVDKSYRLGLEVDANIALNDEFSLNSNFALSKNTVQDLLIDRDGALQNFGDTNIAFSPNVISTNAIEYAPDAKFRTALIGKYVGEQYMSNTDNEASKLDSYFVADLNFSYTIDVKSVFNSIVFTGMVNNLLNLEYEDRGYTYLDTWSGPTASEIQGYYPQATRNFILGMTMIF